MTDSNVDANFLFLFPTDMHSDDIFSFVYETRITIECKSYIYADNKRLLLRNDSLKIVESRLLLNRKEHIRSCFSLSLVLFDYFFLSLLFRAGIYTNK